MNKLVFVLLLVSAPAWAEWTLITQNENGETAVYADLATIRKRDEMVKMWLLYDYKIVRRPAGTAVFSHKSQVEFDCREEQARTLYSSWFSGNMGHGNLVHSDANQDGWQPVSPESVIEDLWKVELPPKFRLPGVVV